MKGLKKYILLDDIIDIKNYKESFAKWMKIREKFEIVEDTNQQKLFKKYLHTIKPIIHTFTSVIKKISPQLNILYTDSIKYQNVVYVRDLFQPLNKFEVKTSEIEKLQKQSIQRYKENKFDEIFKMDLNNSPKNDEVQWWGNILDVPEIAFESKVKKGKGEGLKSLGMPTANLHVTEDLQKILLDYPNGIYYVDFKFTNGQVYGGAASLGTNPHYENHQDKRICETYVLHDFGNQKFYGEQVKVTLKKLIRFEGKFSSFSQFLNGMHNDITIAKKLRKKQQNDQKN